MKSSIKSIVAEYYKYRYLLGNLFYRQYLHRGGWDSKLQSLIPPDTWYFDPYDDSTWHIATPTLFYEKRGVKARYLIEVRWKTNKKGDPRGIKRLKKKGGWLSSPDIKYYDLKEQRGLDGKERESFVKDKLFPRIVRQLGIREKDINNRYIKRYRFNFICYYHEATLAGLQGHHDIEANPVAASLINPAYRDSIGEEWYLATDDRPRNILPRTREEHNTIHNERGDKGFFTYTPKDEDVEEYNPQAVKV